MPSSPSNAEPWIHEVGARRGRYEVTKQLARGGYGEVYAVRDLGGQTWAMKLLRLARESDRRAAERALQEAALLRRIGHVNVVRYRDAFLDGDGTVVLVTEYLAGRSLRVLLAEGAQPVERALRLGGQLADAAAAVHAVRAVHRDIKPENIFVISNDTLKLFDFGLAKCDGITFKTTRPVGTPRYMAPDQLAYRPRFGGPPDPRWDVYAIGLVVFEMLAGFHPFDLDPSRAPRTAAEVIERHLYGVIPTLSEVMSDIPSTLSDTIAHALQRQPENRLASASALAAKLGAVRSEWTAVHGEHAGITAELRRLSPDAFDAPPESLDGPTLERPHPGGTDVTVPRTERMPLLETARSTGRFGTERIVPHFDPAALAARSPKSPRNP